MSRKETEKHGGAVLTRTPGLRGGGGGKTETREDSQEHRGSRKEIGQARRSGERRRGGKK